MHILKRLRAALGGLTQEELAKLVGVAPRTIHYWECESSKIIPTVKNISILWKIIRKHKLQSMLNTSHEDFCDKLTKNKLTKK